MEGCCFFNVFLYLYDTSSCPGPWPLMGRRQPTVGTLVARMCSLFDYLSHQPSWLQRQGREARGFVFPARALLLLSSSFFFFFFIDFIKSPQIVIWFYSLPGGEQIFAQFLVAAHFFSALHFWAWALETFIYRTSGEDMTKFAFFDCSLRLDNSTRVLARHSIRLPVRFPREH